MHSNEDDTPHGQIGLVTSVYLHPSHRQLLDELVIREDRSRSSIVRRALIEYAKTSNTTGDSK